MWWRYLSDNGIIGGGNSVNRSVHSLQLLLHLGVHAIITAIIELQ